MIGSACYPGGKGNAKSPHLVALIDQVTQGSSNFLPCQTRAAVQEIALWHGVAAGQEQAMHSKNAGHPVTSSPGTGKSRGSEWQLQSCPKNT